MTKNDKDSARYIVRNVQYPQSEAYSVACQSIADKLYSRNFRDLYSFIDHTAEHMRDKRIALRGNNPDPDDDYALPRTSAFMATPHLEMQENRLWKAFKAFRKMLPGDTSAVYRAAFYDERGEKPLKLTEISNLVPHLRKHKDTWPLPLNEMDAGGAKVEHYDMQGQVVRDNHMLIHPIYSNNEETEAKLRDHLTPRLLETMARMEPIVSRANENFRKAMDRELSPKKREAAAYDCYALLSHSVRMERGTATMARIALDYLSNKIGFEVPYTKEDVDLNTTALFTNPKDFTRLAMQPVDGAHPFFDDSITGQEVRQWQKNIIRQRQTAEKDKNRGG
jgi:hypothetical protein